MDQPRATPVKGLRGDDRIGARMVADRPCFHRHATLGEGEKCEWVVSSQALSHSASMNIYRGEKQRQFPTPLI